MKKLFALMLTVSLLLTMAACGGAAPSATPSAESAEAEVSEAVPEPTSSQAEEPEAEPAYVEESVSAEEPVSAEDVEETSEEEVFSADVPLSAALSELPPPTLPITDEDISYEIWMAAPGSIAKEGSLAQTNTSYSEWQKRTGVNLSFIVSNFFTQMDEFNLMAAAGNYPAIMNAVQNLYSGGPDAAIEDEIFVELTDYMEEYAPNYNALINSRPGLREDVSTPEGNLVAFYALFEYEKFGLGDRGYIIREDWLNKLNMDVPKTTDQLHEVLTGFKDELGASAPFVLPTSGITDFIMGGFGVTNTFYVEDGTIKYGGVEEGFKEYLELMHQWYDEGLIYHDFYSFSNQIMFDDLQMIGTGQVGLYFNETGTMVSYGEYSNDPDFLQRAIAPVVKEEGGTAYMMQFVPTYIDQPRLTITTNCEKPEIAVQMIDYLYSEEGILLANYGVEGITFEYDEDGTPHLTDLILNNPEGYAYRDALALNVNDVCGTIFDPLRGATYYNENQLSSWDDWSDQNLDYSRALPSGEMLNVNEKSEYAAIYSDISTFVSEAIVKYIIGDFDFATYDTDFVGQLESMNIGRCIELYQQAYDRYMETHAE